MLQRDYLVQMITQFVEAIIRTRTKENVDPQEAADSLETALNSVLDIDASVLLAMGPESIAAVMQLSGVDPKLAVYIAYSLRLEAQYLQEAGDGYLAELRLGQAQSIAETFGFDLAEVPIELEESND